jgi:hypothetical protein
MKKSSNRGLSVHQPFVPPLLMSIHGIRTRGEWQKTFAAVVSGSGSRCESFDYGRYGLLRLTFPPFNSRMVDRFYNWYAAQIKACRGIDLDQFDRRPSVVAHSLGSWILGRALLKYEDIRFDKIIMAGSILPRDFDWATVFARDQASAVRNECGQKDPWPSWASRLVARTGTAGLRGFDWFGPNVENIFSEWFGHSDALLRPHIENFWLPFLSRPPSPLVLLNGRDIHDGAQFDATLHHTGTIIDEEAYGELPNYDEVEIPRGLSLDWIRINPDIYTFLLDRRNREPAGYFNTMPVSDVMYQRLRRGEITDKDVSANDIVPFIAGRTVRIYLMSIAIAEKYRRWGDGLMQLSYVQLLTGFIDKLRYHAKCHYIRATHFIAIAWTVEGRRMCEFFGMSEVGKDRFGDPIYELDIDALLKADRRSVAGPMRELVDMYRSMVT